MVFIFRKITNQKHSKIQFEKKKIQNVFDHFENSQFQRFRM